MFPSNFGLEVGARQQGGSRYGDHYHNKEIKLMENLSGMLIGRP